MGKQLHLLGRYIYSSILVLVRSAIVYNMVMVVSAFQKIAIYPRVAVDSFI
jgi:hypothetical protein